jgi:hypothetical protein
MPVITVVDEEVEKQRQEYVPSRTHPESLLQTYETCNVNVSIR